MAIDTDEGITGWGECYNHGPDWALPPLLDYLYLQIQGHDPRRIEFLILKLLQQQDFTAYHYRGATYDTGAKDGFIMANVAFALDRPDIRGLVEADLKALIAALK